ncbi:MAG: hypothetical protein HQM13_02175 [SAR324 cluster bacterium]|nr:hypothetical protein [SAR324 cluster bacterium]
MNNFEKRIITVCLVLTFSWIYFSGSYLMAAPPGLIILERAESDLDFFQEELTRVTRSLGPSPESQGIQSMIVMIHNLKRELWLAKKLLLVKDAVKSEQDKQAVKFIVGQDFDELIAEAQKIVTQLKSSLRRTRHGNLFRYNDELAQFLEVYIEGLRFVQSNL